MHHSINLCSVFELLEGHLLEDLHAYMLNNPTWSKIMYAIWPVVGPFTTTYSIIVFQIGPVVGQFSCMVPQLWSK